MFFDKDTLKESKTAIVKALKESDYENDRLLGAALETGEDDEYIQNQANMILKVRGYIFLNEVYEMLGIPKSAAGQIVGWTYREEMPRGDNYVDFGIDMYRCEDEVILDFNVDGMILDVI